ncbi:MAG: hypothetical protein LQ345_002870, partial [Seirophora villosa]
QQMGPDYFFQLRITPEPQVLISQSTARSPQSCILLAILWRTSGADVLRVPTVGA